MNRRRALIGLVLLVWLLGISQNAETALFWGAGLSDLKQGVRSQTVSVCFVGDAPTSRTARVDQILSYIKEFEYVANVKFNYLGTCPAPTAQSNGNDFHDGDIRVVIPGISISGTGAVPGKGCPMFLENGKYNGKNDGWGSWSNAPWDLPGNRACLYNLKLGDDPSPPPGGSAGNPPSSVPYLNHTLHEFGHALGLGHEHERNDVDKTNCKANGYGGGAGNGFMTPYDKQSVMHYQFLTCAINGNYDNNGLSARDNLAIHILYPEETRVAEFVGTTTVRTSTQMALRSAWKERGANVDYVAKDFAWKLSGTTVSTTPELNRVFTTPQTLKLEFSYRDFLGRNYSYTGVVRVLDPKTFNQQIAGPTAARLPLL